jgi:hypothetical protein
LILVRGKFGESRLFLKATLGDEVGLDQMISYGTILGLYPNLKETYPQLIPNLLMVVEPPKPIKGGHSKVKKRKLWISKLLSWEHRAMDG